jgi:uncharacterized membrane protein YidH (DUF202 family)
MSKLAVILGVAVLAIAVAIALMRLTVTLENPSRNVTIYPNALFAMPLILLGSLLLLYGIAVKNQQDANISEWKASG